MKNQCPNGWSRREFLEGVALMGAASVLCLQPDRVMAAVDPPPETTRIRISKGNPACWAPIYVAEPFLRKEGFTDIQYVFAPTSEKPKMTREGAYDLSPAFSVASMFKLENDPHPAKFLSGLHAGCYALVASERTHSVRDLKGKTVWAGATKNDGPDIFFSAIVEYVGLDPHTDINYVWVSKGEAIHMFLDGKIDAFVSFPPASHELMQKGKGHILIDTNIDKPWSQYFCCMMIGRNDFIKKNPIATKRALRAILKANDIVARDPALATRTLISNKVIIESEYNHILSELSHIPYGKWRDYNPEDTIRFYALRMRDMGMIKSNPQQFIDQHTDWRFMAGLKKEFSITW